MIRMDIQTVTSNYFCGLGKTLSGALARIVESLVESGSCSTYEIARAMSRRNQRDFNTNEKNIIYWLSNPRFQVDDQFWRMHMQMIFDMMREHQQIEKGQVIPIQVDFTSIENHFLILSASVVFHDRAVPLYFTMRVYPKKENTYDHKKMESAFLKGLKHALSKQYRYAIVADRGFGNARFVAACADAGFDYVIRIEPNMRAKIGENEGILGDIAQEGQQKVSLKNWHADQDVWVKSEGDSRWVIVSNVAESDAVEIYEKRFKIEKLFQDLKSSGFDIESSKIRKYDRFKRMAVLCMIAHSLLVFIGYCVREKLPQFLKKSPVTGAMTLAYLLSDARLSET